MAIDGLDLHIAEGELLVLLGPSGCGKTTTLRCVAGLESPDAGRISIDDAVVFDSARRRNVPAAKRNVGMVFQSYALWPHKTVRGNIAYPLKARRMNGAPHDGWVEETAALVDCGGLLERYPGEISGGQQQRVALARGLVARPRVMLFDEPLSNLDARLRDQVRGELHELHRRLRYTGIYVTHDQLEALAIADRIAVMRAGAVEQLGEPQEVFNRPRSEYVAEFVGYVNHVPLRRSDSGWTTMAGPASGLEVAAGGAGDAVSMRVRPEDVEVIAGVGSELDGRVVIRGARVVDRVYAGRSYELLVQADECRLRAHVSVGQAHSEGLEAGAEVALATRFADCRFFNADGLLLDSGVRATVAP